MNITEKVAEVFGSPSNMQELSRGLHVAVGVSLLIVSILIILNLTFKKKITALLIPIYLIFYNTVVNIYGYFSQGIYNFFNVVEITFNFPGLYIHTVMSLIIIIGSIIEILYLKGKLKNKLPSLALSFSFMTVGSLFVLHPHEGFHDEKSAFIHSIFGLLLIFTGAMLLVGRLATDKLYKFSAHILSAAALIGTSILFIKFKEPPLAYSVYFPIKAGQATSLDMNQNGIVYITSEKVIPQNIKIKKGGSVTFYQVDESLHGMASGPHPTHTKYPPLNIGYLKKGESQTVVFPIVGSFGFHDHINDTNTNLQGKIEVYN